MNGGARNKYAVLEWGEDVGIMRWSAHLLCAELLDMPAKIVLVTKGWQAAHAVANKANTMAVQAAHRGEAVPSMSVGQWIKLLRVAGAESDGRVVTTVSKEARA